MDIQGKIRAGKNYIAQTLARHLNVPTLRANVANSVTDGRRMKKNIALAHPYHEGKS